MGDKGANPDGTIARIAANQHGAISSRQLLEIGVTRSAISKRVRSGRLHRIHQGVYSVGYVSLSKESRWMAAVLACGRGAVLSHRSAAELWKLLDPADRPIEVSVPTTSGRKHRAGIHIHRRASLKPGSCTRHNRVPVTTAARTICDLRKVVSASQLRRAIRQAEVFGMQTGVRESTRPTRSDLEDRFLRLCRRHRLPAPEVNARVGRYEVDFLWRRQSLIVETDGYRYHRGAQAFEDDHARDLDLRGLGYDLRRFSYRQVTESPTQVAAAVRQALETAPASPPQPN